MIAYALAGIGDKRAVAPLMAILLKRNEGSFKVVQALRDLTEQFFGLNKDISDELQQARFDEWQQWWQANREKYEK